MSAQRLKPIENRGCSVDGCTRTHNAKGLCNNHYAQQRKAILETRLATVEARIAAVRELHAGVALLAGGRLFCEECVTLTYPCATIQALDEAVAS